MTATSRIPVALDALLTLARATFNPSTVSVLDGPPIRSNALDRDQRLFVGDAAQDETAISGTLEASAFRGDRREAFTVGCIAEALDRAASMTVARTAAFNIHGTFDLALRADPTVGGLLNRARIEGPESVMAQQTSDGALCSVLFQVAVEIPAS